VAVEEKVYNFEAGELPPKRGLYTVIVKRLFKALEKKLNLTILSPIEGD
jgi:hypothetical protein